MPQSAVNADAINLQDLPEELLIKVLTILKDSRACASAALLCRRLAAGWRGVEHLFFAEPADEALHSEPVSLLDFVEQFGQVTQIRESSLCVSPAEQGLK